MAFTKTPIRIKGSKYSFWGGGGVLDTGRGGLHVLKFVIKRFSTTSTRLNIKSKQFCSRPSNVHRTIFLSHSFLFDFPHNIFSSVNVTIFTFTLTLHSDFESRKLLLCGICRTEVPLSHYFLK